LVLHFRVVVLTYFDPQPRPDERPARMPSPFDPGAPHPLARRAAEQLQERLRGPLAAMVAANERGKMFGVLVVADGAGRVGYLAGFSGMLAGRWSVEGFVEPVFDASGRAATWPAVEAELDDFDRRLRALADERARGTAELEALETAQAAARDELAAAHRERRQRREEERAALTSAAVAGSRSLADESRADAVAARRLRAEQRESRAPLAMRLAAVEEERVALGRTRAARSCVLLEELFAGYQLTSARGEVRALRALFAPATPPGGSGDCAAPKLFAHALSAGLRPLALAELWWGPSPATGGRHHGHYYPACRGKCGPVLAHMLDGLEVEPAPRFGEAVIPPSLPRTVFEDPWLVVVEKPEGLLSVPGRGGLEDSVLSRLRARYPEAGGPLVVHRLDLDTSGLMMLARDAATHHALQGQFWRREIEKRYVAVLDGAPAGESGRIELALRVDLDDRPRQIFDPLHGKPALTEWRVLSREDGRARVALFPRTGRTHQLRVHAAHPQGLGAPIVGDRLYGRAGARLLLHAESLSFVHPQTGQRVELVSPAPF
jgi:tRNA pseudouridine32 synthase/23S rRNA pseudouridine746 synthase